jgi:NADH dehydrogenase
MRRVLLLGAGAAGYAAGRVLVPALAKRSHARITLLSVHTQHVIRQLLPEVAAGLADPRLSVVELLSLRDLGPMDLISERIAEIDLAGHRVRTDRQDVPYDYLLVALGRESRLPAGWGDSELVYRFRSDRDAARLRNQLAALRQREGSEPVRMAIVGGGPTGCDLAGTLAERERLRELGGAGQRGDGAPLRPLEITLVESTDTLLPQFPKEFGDYALEVLDGIGVQIVTGLRATGPDADGLRLEGGRALPADVVVWVGGTRASKPLRDLDLPKRGDGVLLSDEYLRLAGHPDVFLAGASAGIPDAPAYPLGAGFNADCGRLAAENLLAAMSGRAPQAISLENRPTAVSLGAHRAIARFRGVTVKGRPAWTLHRVALARAIPEWTNRLGVVGGWAKRLF